MPTMVVQGQVQTGQTALDFGITDLMVMEHNGVPILYASSGQTGGLTAFGLGVSGTASFLDSAMYSSAWSDGALRSLTLLDVNGVLSIAVAGSGEDQLYLYDLNSDGSIGAAQQMSGMSPSINRLLDVDQTDTSMLFMADTGASTIRGFSITSNGSLSQAMSVTDTSSTYAAEVMAISSARVLNNDYMIGASQMEKGVSVYRVDGATLVNTGNAGVNEGLGIMTPTAMEVVEIGGRSFILLASAPNDGQGQSGAITVMELAQDGSLVATDHVIDTGATRFGNVQSLEVVEADGRTYVMAGGGDDGLTLFVLLPHGRLQLLSTISGEAGLENVSSMAANYSGGSLHMYVTSEIQGGFIQISADVSNQGVIIEGDHSGGTINGGGLDDILIGGAQNDSIQGNGGDDLLEDGLGVDTLNGGNGADIYILRSDFTHDVIQDFQPNEDRLDLSAWPMFYDPAQIGYTATANGAILDWRGETLEIITRNGQTLSFAQVEAAIMASPDRVPDFSSYGGNDGNQLIDGTAINDAIAAGAGHDTVNGLAGDDYIDGGAGWDSVNGGGGNDTIVLGSGNDYASGGDNNDLIYGGAGGDVLWGGSQGDTIYGGDGGDVIRGQRGNDLLFGGASNDVILGDNNEDTIYGEAGNDALRGGNGHDEIYGGIGNDRLFGANGNDTIFGGTGDDLIRAGFQADLAYGEEGDDYIVGGGGNDTLVGGTGNDTMEGNFNADHFVFDDNHGQDVIRDFDANWNPEKLVFRDHSMMNSYGDVMSASVQQGADVVINTGGGNSILLEGVQLGDLHAQDFLF